MYLEHYRLKLKPFEIDPDPKFIWFGAMHREAFAALKNVIFENRGLVAIMGEPGTGKSTFLNAVVRSFDKQILSAKIHDPSLSDRDFFNLVADAFGIEKSFNSKKDFFLCLTRFALDAFANSKKVLLIIDEAQRLNASLLEKIQFISNIKKEGQFLINIVFVGQNTFSELFKANRALSKTIVLSYTLQPLTETETAEYIIHRLRVAGSETEIFTSSAIAEIFRLSGGIPRLINMICDNALLSGYSLKTNKIRPEVILNSQGPGHRLIHEIYEIDKEFAAHHTVPLQKHRPRAVSAIAAQTSPKNLPRGPITRLFTNLLEMLRLKPLTFKGRLALTISLILVFGLVGYYYFPNVDDERSLTKVQSHTEQIPNRQRTLQTDGSLSARSGLKDATMAAEDKKIGGSDERESDIAPSLIEDQSHAPEIARLKNQLRFLLQQLQTVSDAKAQLEQNLKALEKDFNLEKDSKSKLSAEVSAKDAELQELRKILEVFRSQQLALAEEVKTVKKDNAQLQAQLEDLKSRKAVETSADVSKTQAAQKPSVDRLEKGEKQLSPTDIIDFIIKKKTH